MLGIAGDAFDADDAPEDKDSRVSGLTIGLFESSLSLIDALATDGSRVAA